MLEIKRFHYANSVYSSEYFLNFIHIFLMFSMVSKCAYFNTITKIFFGFHWVCCARFFSVEQCFSSCLIFFISKPFKRHLNAFFKASRYVGVIRGTFSRKNLIVYSNYLILPFRCFSTCTITYSLNQLLGFS